VITSTGTDRDGAGHALPLRHRPIQDRRPEPRRLDAPGSQSTFWAKISAMSVLGTLPVFFAVAAFQRYLVRGISPGAVKG